MGSKPGRPMISWRRGLCPFIKCLAKAIHVNNPGSCAKSASLLTEMAPWISTYILETQSREPTLHAIAQRIDKGTRPGYENEWPDRRYPDLYVVAEALVANGVPISRAQVEQIVENEREAA